MNVWFYFNADGDCLGKTDIVPDIPEVAHTVELDDTIRPATQWRNPATGTVETRAEVDLALPPEMQVGDVVQFTVPPNTRVYESGVDTGTAPGATHTIDTSTERSGLIQLRGQSMYRCGYSIHPPEKFARDNERATLMADTVVNATPAQINNYIETNVTDLESAKQVMKLLARIAILAFKK